MKQWILPIGFAFFIGAGFARPAVASEAVYQYRIEHPSYGNIGTYANVVKTSGDTSEVDTELHVAVKLLGIVMFREDATRTERWQGNRLVAFDGVTETNGKKLELHGRAEGDSFVVTTPDGATVTAPAKVATSNPWAAFVLETDTMMSTKTGRIDKVTVSGGNEEPVTFDGKNFRLRRYEIDGTKRQFVWLDQRGVAVAFRTEEDGTAIDFVLAQATTNEAQNRPQPQ